MSDSAGSTARRSPTVYDHACGSVIAYALPPFEPPQLARPTTLTPRLLVRSTASASQTARTTSDDVLLDRLQRAGTAMCARVVG